MAGERDRRGTSLVSTSHTETQILHSECSSSKLVVAQLWLTRGADIRQGAVRAGPGPVVEQLSAGSPTLYSPTPVHFTRLRQTRTAQVQLFIDPSHQVGRLPGKPGE